MGTIDSPDSKKPVSMLYGHFVRVDVRGCTYHPKTGEVSDDALAWFRRDGRVVPITKGGVLDRYYGGGQSEADLRVLWEALTEFNRKSRGSSGGGHEIIHIDIALGHLKIA